MVKDKNPFSSKKKEYLWLLHKGKPRSNLLILRFDDEGNALPPGIIFNSCDWKNEYFVKIQDEENEKQRMPAAIKANIFFIRNEVGDSAYKFCFNDEKVRYCVITPLSKGKDFREPLIDNLIEKVLKKNLEYCSCERAQGRSKMILCDNLKCKIGWYHESCIDWPEDRKQWFCKNCEKNKTDIEETKYDNNESLVNVFNQSDERIQLARSVASALEDYSMDKKQVIDMFSKRFRESKWNPESRNTSKCLCKEVKLSPWAISVGDRSKIYCLQ